MMVSVKDVLLDLFNPATGLGIVFFVLYAVLICYCADIGVTENNALERKKASQRTPRKECFSSNSTDYALLQQQHLYNYFGPPYTVGFLFMTLGDLAVEKLTGSAREAALSELLYSRLGATTDYLVISLPQPRKRSGEPPVGTDDDAAFFSEDEVLMAAQTLQLGLVVVPLQELSNASIGLHDYLPSVLEARGGLLYDAPVRAGVASYAVNEDHNNNIDGGARQVQAGQLPQLYEGGLLSLFLNVALVSNFSLHLSSAKGAVQAAAASNGAARSTTFGLGAVLFVLRENPGDIVVPPGFARTLQRRTEIITDHLHRLPVTLQDLLEEASASSSGAAQTLVEWVAAPLAAAYDSPLVIFASPCAAPVASQSFIVNVTDVEQMNNGQSKVEWHCLNGDAIMEVVPLLHRTVLTRAG